MSEPPKVVYAQPVTTEFKVPGYAYFKVYYDLGRCVFLWKEDTAGAEDHKTHVPQVLVTAFLKAEGHRMATDGLDKLLTLLEEPPT